MDEYVYWMLYMNGRLYRTLTLAMCPTPGQCDGIEAAHMPLMRALAYGWAATSCGRATLLVTRWMHDGTAWFFYGISHREDWNVPCTPQPPGYGGGGAPGYA